jgi:hypothetical protein
MTKNDHSDAGGTNKRPVAVWSVDELRAWKATLMPFREAIDQIAKARGIGNEAATDRLRLWISSGRVRAIQCSFWPSRLTLNRDNLPREWCVKAVAYVEEGDRVGVVDGGQKGPWMDLREALFDPAEIHAMAQAEVPAVAHGAQDPAKRKLREPKKKELWADVVGRCAARLHVDSDASSKKLSVIEKWVKELIEEDKDEVAESTARRYASALLLHYCSEQAAQTQTPANRKAWYPKDLWPDVLGCCAARLIVMGDSGATMVDVTKKWIIELAIPEGEIGDDVASRYASALLLAHHEERSELLA